MTCGALCRHLEFDLNDPTAPYTNDQSQERQNLVYKTILLNKIMGSSFIFPSDVGSAQESLQVSEIPRARQPSLWKSSVDKGQGGGHPRQEDAQSTVKCHTQGHRPQPTE